MYSRHFDQTLPGCATHPAFLWIPAIDFHGPRPSLYYGCAVWLWTHPKNCPISFETNLLPEVRDGKAAEF